MAWKTLSEADILASLSGPEKTAHSNAAKAPGQVDPLPIVLQRTIRTVRGRVKAWSINILGDGQTIPDELEQQTINIARYELLTRLPGMEIDDAREVVYKAALSDLKDVARGEISIEPPYVPTVEKQAVQSPSICGRQKQFSRRDQDGL